MTQVSAVAQSQQTAQFRLSLDLSGNLLVRVDGIDVEQDPIAAQRRIG